MAKNNNSQNVINFVKNRKLNLISVFNGKCCLCGFNQFSEALEFHHVIPEEKEFPLSSNVMKSLDKQLNEARKCVLVCANCHRGIHGGYLQIPDDYKKFFNEEIAQQLLIENHEIRQGKKYYCINCGVLISRNAERCAKCSSLEQRIVIRPEREILKQLIRTKPFTHIAKEYKVSDNAIRKWCLAENLPTKKTEINQYTDSEWEKI